VYEQADHEVQQEARLVAAYLERETQYVLSQLTLVLEEGMMLTGDQASLAGTLSNLDVEQVMRMLGFGSDSLVKTDLLKIVGPDGEAMLELHRDLLAGRTLDDEALMATILQGGSSGGVVTTTDGKSAYLVGATQLPGDEGPGGVLMLGTKVDRGLLTDIGLSERELFVYTGQGIAASTSRAYESDEWLPVLASAGGGSVSVGDSRYVMAKTPVEIDGRHTAVSVATVMPLDAVAAEVRGQWTRAGLIFAVGAMVMILAGLIVARRVVDPILKLTAATAQVKQGDFDTRIDVARGDEIGQLARAFNTMSEELKTRDLRLAESFNEVKRLSETDALTGLLNHRMILERLGMELARAQRYGGRFCLIVIDLDNFKLLNDTYGHPVGDEALRRFSRLLLDETRAVDAVGRHGGDEFMLVLPECGPLEAAGAAEKLQSVLAAYAFEVPGGSHVPLKMSLGVACYPDDGEDVNTLIALADANLYLSKSRGGGTVTGTQSDGMTADDATIFGMLGSLVTLVDNKDRYTRHHSEEVTRFALAIGDALGLSDESQRVLRVAGLLHDIGKIGVPDRILRKPGHLTDDEYAVIKQHSILGDSIIATIPDLAEVRAAVVAHHERYDGGGYPHQMEGESIPLLARILSVAERYEGDPWDELILEWAAERESVSIADVLTMCLEKKKDAWTQWDRNRVARCLRANGWTRFNSGSRGAREWRYRRPTFAE
jgi:diguanylate cyclase (GGDEF)-like protein/putative nucleotidyltransferase with HDIG domain